MGRLTLEALNSAIAALYDAAADPAAWPRAMREVARVWGATAHIAQVQTPGATGTELIATDFAPRGLELYARHYWKVDPWTERGLRMPPLRPNRGEELVDPRVLVRSEIYNELSKPYLGDLFHLLGGVAPLGDGAVGMVGLLRARDAETFSRHEQRLFGLLLPHYQRALRLRREFAKAGSAGAIGFAALDALSVGAIVVSSNGAVVFANRAAEAIAAENDGLRLAGRDRPVGAAAPSESRALRALVALAADSTSAATDGGALRLSRPSGREPYAVLVAPLPLGLADGREAGGLALLLVTDPERRPRPTAAVLSSLYGLTPREAELAEALVAVGGLDAAADRLALTRETARSYLKRIFAKTGAARQAELVGLLLRSTGSVR